MEKIPDENAKKSTVDSLIEKIRDEINRRSKEDLSNTRKLTVSSTVVNNALDESTNDIDRQISNLEILIKRLQDEIVDMSNKSEHSREYIPQVTEEESQDIDRVIIEDNFDDPNRIFPVIISDTKIPFRQETEESRKFDKTITDLLNVTSHNNASDPNPETFSAIRNNFSQLFHEKNNESRPKDDDKSNDEDLNILINELKAEISEKMEELKDVDTDNC
ncbi:uncharacterized protein LOC131843094 [Achroia grisella]|uniref:uncharacterized protein LOC131843094 n=1 Tax=Achroia grisella TaxID=688607 RepID=UPI0027D24DC0|nr:uncharacterized protein LOC131843094 [Achroia grisella]